MKDLIDRFTLLLAATVFLATLLPCSGLAARVLGWISVAGVAALFFLHGARLSRAAVWAGLSHWRLHTTVLACTFVLFPLLGFAIALLASMLIAPALVTGLLYLCILPSTVGSSIAFTSIARGNVPAAVCSASVSNLLGVFLTPLLASLMLARGGQDTGSALDAIQAIVVQLLLPFLAGHLLRSWIGEWVSSRKSMLNLFDRGTILLVVYVAFSEAVLGGVWRQVSPAMMLITALICLVLLALVLAFAAFIAKRMHFNREDRVTILFCGSKKSLVTGVPMANILFAGHPALGLIVLPLMLFHQIQLMVCAVLANRLARDSLAVASNEVVNSAAK